MVYIYKEKEVVKYIRDSEIPEKPYIELERMIPQPVKDGYTAVLNADFESNKVWYDLIKNPRTLNQAKQEMLSKIIQYDSSDTVNSFTFNGIKCWFDAEQRRGYAQSILSCKTLQVETIQVPIGNTIVTMKVSDADIMLARVHLYADNCFMVTLQHKNTVNNLTTIEEVDSFDYKSGYPDKLVFTS